jgi:hypothetical protein
MLRPLARLLAATLIAAALACASALVEDGLSHESAAAASVRQQWHGRTFRIVPDATVPMDEFASNLVDGDGGDLMDIVVHGLRSRPFGLPGESADE